jgi:hypothetical protein
MQVALLAFTVSSFFLTAAPTYCAETVSGEIVDLACYMPDPGNKGAGHKKCAHDMHRQESPDGTADR